MFDHVTVRASDVEASRRFYATVLAEVGAPEVREEHGGYLQWRDFSLTAAEEPSAVTRHLHVGFVAPSRAAVDAFWRAGVDAGYRSDGEPGPRPQYVEDYYGAFLLDPDGNSAEAVHFDGTRDDGLVDHLWIRVADVERARRFYELIGPFGGFRLVGEEEGRATFSRGEDIGGSFSVVAADGDWPAVEHLHLAFGTDDERDVERFWQAAVDAGHRDNGGPGERPEYHAGYIGAFVLDPDGNNVEVVHDRR